MLFTLFHLLEEAADFLDSLELGVREDLDFSLAEHREPQHEVAEEVPALDLVLLHHAELVYPAAFPDRVDEGPVEDRDVLFAGLEPFLLGAPLEDLHESRDVHAVGAAGHACFAVGADPDGFRAQDFVFHAELDHAHGLVGEYVHPFGRRASAGALLALEAAGDAGLGFFLDPFQQRAS